MAVVGSAQELPDSPTAQVSTGSDPKATFTRKFLVQTGSHGTGPIEVLYSSGVPQANSLYAFGSEAHLSWVTDRRAERVAPNSLYWRVEVTYESPDTENSEPDNPLAEPASISVTFENTQEVCWYAIDGNGDPVDGIRASNGELFSPSPTKDVARPVLRIQRNEIITSPIVATAASYINKVNSTSFWGVDAGLARCTAISVDRQVQEIQQESGTFLFPYLSVSYEFKFHERGWQLELIDHGSFHLDGGSGSGSSGTGKTEFVTDDGHPFLGLLSNGQETESPEFLTFTIYGSANFDALSLPTSFS